MSRHKALISGTRIMQHETMQNAVRPAVECLTVGDRHLLELIADRMEHIGAELDELKHIVGRDKS